MIGIVFGRTLSRRATLAGLAMLAAAGAPALAQNYPTRPITILTPFAAGSVTDTTARAIAGHLQETLGQPVIVENRAGAGGLLAASAVAKAKPDGYTFLITTNSTHSAISLFKNVPYDPIKDFTPVARIGSFPSMVAVNSGLPFKTMQELVAHAKQNPGKLSCAHGNSTGHIACEAIQQRTKTDIVRVAYRSNPTAIVDLMAGHVPMMIPDFGTGMPQLEAGKIRPLAVLTRQRSAQLPDVPTLMRRSCRASICWPGPACSRRPALPPEIAKRIASEIDTFLAKEDVKKRMLKSGVEVFYTGPEEFAGYVKSELVKWGSLIKEVGIPPQ